jgi:hypothetical protein
VNLDALLALTPEGTLLPTRPLAPEERAALVKRFSPGTTARTELVLSLMNAAVLRAMSDATFDALVTDAVDARAASGLTWLDEPWATWGRLLNDEGDRRQPRVTKPWAVIAGEAAMHKAQCAKLLAVLKERGERGATNPELTEIAERLSGRIFDLRREGWTISCRCEAAGLYRYRLLGWSEPKGKAA